MNIVNLIICLLCGALGGLLYHTFWLIKLGQSGPSIPPSDSQHRNFRISLMALSLTAGAAAGFLVLLWNLNLLRSDDAELNKIATIAAIAGLSGESLLGLLRRISGV